MANGDELKKFLKANLIIQLRSLPNDAKPELILNSAGFTSKEIADFLDKKPKTVNKTLERAGKSKNKKRRSRGRKEKP